METKVLLSHTGPLGIKLNLLQIHIYYCDYINWKIYIFFACGGFLGPGGDPAGVFALASVQGVWKLSVKRPLDRENQDRYLLNITASDSLFATQVIVEVTIIDTNDNSPICNQVWV